MNKIDYIEFARQMRENKVTDEYGRVICSPELWELIASTIESKLEEMKQ